MFEDSLLSQHRMARPRRRFRFVTAACLVHLVGIFALLTFELRRVEALPEPQVPVTFFEELPPPPPPPVAAAPPPPPPPAAAAAEPVATPLPLPEIPLQPVTIPEAPPERVAEAAAAFGPAVGEPGGESGGVPGGVPGGTGTAPGGSAEGEGEAVLRVGGKVTKPVAIFRPDPRYPEAGRRARIQGPVILEAIIDREGRVTQLKVLRGLPFGLTEAALAAVQQWRFEPARLGDVSVAVYYTLTVSFHLQ